MKKKLDLFLKKNYQIFLKSLKNINLNIVILVFYDLLFYSLSALLIYLGFKNIEKSASAVNLPSNILALNTPQVEEISASVTGFYYLLIFTVLLLVFLVILNWSLFKGLNWRLAVKKKFSLKFLLKFLLLNLVWLSIWILLLYFTLTNIKQYAIPSFVLAILAIAIYFTNILYAKFAVETTIKSVKKAFKIAFTKIHYLILPCGIMPFIVMIVFFRYIIPLMSFAINLQQITIFAFAFLSITIFIAWLRLYIVEAVNSVA